MQYSADAINWGDTIDYPNTKYVKFDGQITVLTYREFSEDGKNWFWGRKPRTTKYYRDRLATEDTARTCDIQQDDNPFTD